MKSIFAFFLLFSLSLKAQTSFQGGIYANTTWTLANSPYTITGSVVVFPGNTLTIEPGVEILIDNSTNSNIYIETRGTINCVGTSQLPIKIRTLYDTTNVGWQGFVCTNSQGGNLIADQFHIANAQTPFNYEAPLSLIQYTNCKFSHCYEAITVGNSLVLNNCQFIANYHAIYGWSYFTLNNCYFNSNDVAINAYSTAFQMTNSDFIDNQIGLTFSAGVFDSMYVANCSFLNNGVGINFPNNGKIEDCYFSDNTIGIQSVYGCEVLNNQFIYNEIALEASVLADIHDNQINQNFGAISISGVSNIANSPIIYNNEICNNINFSVNNNTNMNYSLLENCFCGLDSTEIELSIIDGYDDITKGLINYDVYDSTCTTVTSSVIKFSQQPASIDETNETIFPVVNPFTNELAITFKDAKEHVIVIETFDGKLLYSGATTGLVLPTTNWSTGTYYITIDQKNHKQLIKL
ncbi:MAG: hypothetical protein ACEQR5_04275 [Moraxellaceae bacterium]